MPTATSRSGWNEHIKHRLSTSGRLKIKDSIKPFPLNILKAANGRVGELVEGRGREIQIC